MSSYELKFLVSRTQAEQAEAWASAHLALDPHADAALDGAYHVRSIYCDTTQLDVFFRNEGYRRRKFRLRRYGGEAAVYLERKSKPGDRVSKRRTAVSGHEIARLRDAAADAAWPGFWFHQRLLLRRLEPRCLITYDRRAHVGMGHEGPMRLTLDRNIHCWLMDGYSFELSSRRGPENGILLLPDSIILELKFQSILPAWFKGLIQDLKLVPAGVSKYRLGIQACGLAANGPHSAAPAQADKAG